MLKTILMRGDNYASYLENPSEPMCSLSSDGGFDRSGNLCNDSNGIDVTSNNTDIIGNDSKK